MAAESQGKRKAAGAQRKLEDLQAKGLRPPLASLVAQGRMTEAQALEKMAISEEAAFLEKKHDLDHALAVQIASGHADLREVLYRRRFDTYRRQAHERSVFQEAVESGEVWWLYRADRSPLRARVIEAGRYDVVVEGHPNALAKRSIALMAPEAVAAKVRRRVKRDPALEIAEPAAHPKDRFPLGDRRLFRRMEGGEEVSLALCTGDRLRGVVRGFSRYEFWLEVKGGVRACVLRHAVTDFGSTR